MDVDKKGKISSFESPFKANIEVDDMDRQHIEAENDDFKNYVD